MTREDFQHYLDAFNRDDFDGFSSFYAEDVDFNLGDRKRIVGRQGIVDFYRVVKQHIHEDLRINDIAIAPDGIGLHVYTKFTTFKDWPDFELWPTMPGDVRRSRASCSTSSTLPTSSPRSNRRASGHIKSGAMPDGLGLLLQHEHIACRSDPPFENLVRRPVPADPHPDIGNDALAARDPPLEGGRSHMRGHHHIGQSEQPRVDLRLELPDIETRPRRASAVPAPRPSASSSTIPPREGVDEIDMRPHQSDPAPVR